MPVPRPDTVESFEYGRRPVRAIRHERADARHDVCARGRRLYAVLRGAGRHQVFAWRRPYGRRVYRARGLRRPDLAWAEIPVVRSCRYVGPGDAHDGVAWHADRPLPGHAPALGTGAQHTVDRADAWDRSARKRAPFLSAGRQSKAVSRPAAARVGRPRGFQF